MRTGDSQLQDEQDEGAGTQEEADNDGTSERPLTPEGGKQENN